MSPEREEPNYRQGNLRNSIAKRSYQSKLNFDPVKKEANLYRRPEIIDYQDYYTRWFKAKNRYKFRLGSKLNYLW